MSKIRILIVDDNRPLGKLVGVRLEQTGFYTARVEYIPQSAVRAAHEFQPHLLLLDVDMPGMNGPELLRVIRKEPGFEKIPVLFLTSLISAEEAGTQEMISNGNRYLSKSAPIEAVHRCIGRVMAEQTKAVPAN
jgi:DNA-binding response OmpR family regulator